MRSVQPLCPVYGICGGCCYQDIPYAQELSRKEGVLRTLVLEHISCDPALLYPIIPSPQEYHYRNRLDMKFVRTREGAYLMGFTPQSKRSVVEISECAIAREEISAFLPELKTQAIEKIPPRYRQANLVVRCGDEGRVRWGGIGRRSCQLPEGEYFSAEINGRTIYYSLDTFFQANLSILPLLFDKLRALPLWNKKACFYDLYGGVGLFSLGLADSFARGYLIESSHDSTRLARYNVEQNQAEHIQVVEGRVEDCLEQLLAANTGEANIAMIDPPRDGLTEKACRFLSKQARFSHLMYLSCSPETLVRDLGMFLSGSWEILEITPFDFFPKTKHLEVLTILRNNN